MIGTTKPFVRLTGASLALVVALALSTGPALASDEKLIGGCLGEALDDYGECTRDADGFWDRVNCTAGLILDALGCVSEALIPF